VSVHLQRQFDRLKKSILTLGAMVEESVERAIRASQTRDGQLARQVIDDDQKIDLMELDIEEECCHTLALHQPVAFDLRFVVATLKINSDLERIADLAGNMAEQTLLMSELPTVEPAPLDITAMARLVRGMLKESLDALVNVDPERAQQVMDTERQVDAIHRDSYDRVEKAIDEQPERTRQLIMYLGYSRHLERIADHCVNIAEDVLYMAPRRHRATPGVSSSHSIAPMAAPDASR
jgi:phosphate transport system protein